VGGTLKLQSSGRVQNEERPIRHENISDETDRMAVISDIDRYDGPANIHLKRQSAGTKNGEVRFQILSVIGPASGKTNTGYHCL
jgi:hypothetical protein